MSVAEVNFTFNGQHCFRDFGCIFIADATRIISAETVRNEYEIAGMSGSVLMNDRAIHKPYTLTGTLVPLKTPPSLQAAQELARRVSNWLKSGRGELTWDYEPLRMHYAEVNAATVWGYNVWMDGGLAITFQVQPYAYDLMPTVRSTDINAGTSRLLVPVPTSLPCPVSVELTNTGTAAISRVKISTPAGAVVEMAKGMSLARNATLCLDMVPPIGATIKSGNTVTNALRYAVQFDQLELNGPEYLTIETSGKASITATARGCAQ